MSIKNLRNASALAVILSATFLTGCANSLTVGSSEYGCSGLPEGVSCMSAREVYNLTEQPGPVRADPNSISEDGGAADRAAKAALLERRGTRDQGGSARFSNTDNPDVLAASPVNNDPVPIRTRAKVMRVWVAPWESTNGDLNVSGLVFTELEERRWNIGTQQDIDAPRLTPLQNTMRQVQPN
jgi:conjugal transfer pilus assembly protein TraV